MRELVVETPEGLPLRHELAGAGSRYGASLVDAVVLGAAWLSVTLVLALVAQLDPTGQSGFLLGLAAGGLLLLLALYQIAFGILWEGQTPGKRLFGIRVAAADGYPASALQHVLRGLFWPLEAILTATPVPIPLVLMTVTARAQRLGDLVADTLVLREPRLEAGREPFAGERYGDLAGRELELVPALAARLGDEERELLRDALARTGLEPGRRAALLAGVARWLGRKLDLPLEANPPARLKELYLFVRERR